MDKNFLLFSEFYLIIFFFSVFLARPYGCFLPNPSPEKKESDPLHERKKSLGPSHADANSADLCATLFVRLTGRGVAPHDAHRLIKDVYSLIREGGSFTLLDINKSLMDMGWHADAMDAISLELFMRFLRETLSMQIEIHTLH